MYDRKVFNLLLAFLRLQFDVFVPSPLAPFAEAPILKLGNVFLKQKGPNVLLLESLSSSFTCISGKPACGDAQLTHFHTNSPKWAQYKCRARPGEPWRSDQF